MDDVVHDAPPEVLVHEPAAPDVIVHDTAPDVSARRACAGPDVEVDGGPPDVVVYNAAPDVVVHLCCDEFYSSP